jgi:hypothetical protein
MTGLLIAAVHERLMAHASIAPSLGNHDGKFAGGDERDHAAPDAL